MRRHPDRVQDRIEALDAPIRLVPEPSEPTRRPAVLPERGEGLREVHDVAILEKRVAGMVRQRGPGVRMEHPLDDRPVPAGRLAPDSSPRPVAVELMY